MVDGKTKSLYLHSPASIEVKLRPNLKKTVQGKKEKFTSTRDSVMQGWGIHLDPIVIFHCHCEGLVNY